MSLGDAMAANNVNDPVHESLVRVARRTLVVVAIVALALLVWRIRTALLLGFIGVLLAILLRGLADFLSRYTRIPVRWALLLVVTVFRGAVRFVHLVRRSAHQRTVQPVGQDPADVDQPPARHHQRVPGRTLSPELPAAAATGNQPRDRSVLRGHGHRFHSLRHHHRSDAGLLLRHLLRREPTDVQAWRPDADPQEQVLADQRGARRIGVHPRLLARRTSADDDLRRGHGRGGSVDCGGAAGPGAGRHLGHSGIRARRRPGRRSRAGDSLLPWPEAGARPSMPRSCI